MIIFGEYYDFWWKLIILKKIVIFDEYYNFWWKLWFFEENVLEHYDFYYENLRIFDKNYESMKIIIVGEGCDFWRKLKFLTKNLPLTKISIFNENLDFWQKLRLLTNNYTLYKIFHFWTKFTMTNIRRIIFWTKAGY